jgi:hypothetical protein
MSIDVLAGLLDEKLIRILSLFLKTPDKTFSLTEVCRLSKVNNATTFRTLNKLVSEELISPIVIGKTRAYQLSTGQRAVSLKKLLRIEDSVDPVAIFAQKITQINKIRKVIIDSKSSNEAKLIIISETSVKEKIKKACEEIEKEHKFKINFVELTPLQYEGLKETSMFDSNKKTIYSSK